MDTRPFYLQNPKPPTKPPVLDSAAMTLAMAAGRVETVVDVLHGRALKHYAEGLLQYAAIRVGDVGRARRVVTELRAVVASLPSPDLVAPPGIRARLYRMVRELSQRAVAEAVAEGAPPPAAVRPDLPWRAHPASEFKPAVLQRARLDLPDAQAELLELRYARELTPPEIAHVVDRPEEELLVALEEASDAARRLARASSQGEPHLRRLLLEAFALEPQSQLEAEAEQGEETWAPLAEGTVIGRRYAVETRVGSGAFGDVYRARDTEVPGHVVALKLLHQPSLSEGARQVALRELRLIASVFHPSVVQFKDHGWYEQRLWFVMPWYDGETLEARLAREPLGRAEALRIFEPLARALVAMHAAGVRHQDVKPDNIFLARIPGASEDEVLPVLLDLGVAAKDAEMVVAGTPTYFAPEVAAQFASVEHRPLVTTKADVFSLALSLRNALEPSTKADVPGGAVEAFIEQRAREVPSNPQGRDLRFLGPAFERWLSRDPEERPTAEELSRELDVLVRPEARKARRRRVLRWTVPVAIAFASVVAVLYQRAEVQALEADRARMAEAGLRQDLALSQEEMRRLEADAQRSRERARMTREELVGQLAQAEGLLLGARQRLAQREEAHRSTRRELDAVRERFEAARDEVSATRRRLDETQARVVEAQRVAQAEGRRAEEAESDLGAAQATLARVRAEAADLEESVTTLGARVATLDARLAAESAKADRLEADIAQAIGERARAEREVSRLRAEIRRLEAQRAPSPAPVDPQGAPDPSVAPAPTGAAPAGAPAVTPGAS